LHPGHEVDLGEPFVLRASVAVSKARLVGGTLARLPFTGTAGNSQSWFS